MEYIHAALLLHSSKQPINEENVRKVLSAAGVQAEETRVKALVTALEGVNIEEAIKQAVTPPVAAAPAPEAKKEEAAEKKEEEAAAGLASLFG